MTPHQLETPTTCFLPDYSHLGGLVTTSFSSKPTRQYALKNTMTTMKVLRGVLERTSQHVATGYDRPRKGQGEGQGEGQDEGQAAVDRKGQHNPHESGH